MSPILFALTVATGYALIGGTMIAAAELIYRHMHRSTK